MHRLFSSSYETMLGVISFYYFNRIKSKFGKELILVVVLQSLSFVLRNTSPIAWSVLLTVKAVELGFFKMYFIYLIYFFIIFLPIFAASIYFDSIFYGKLTVVPWNFIKFNILDGLSSTFGADPLWKYLDTELPARLNIFFPIAVYGSYLYFKRSIGNPGKSFYTKEKGWSCTGKTQGYIPYLFIYVVVILTYLTKITHKEPKFLLPIFPPIFLLIGFGV